MNRLKALFCRSHLWFILGMMLFLFSHGSVTIPLCSWFAFVFLIRYHRTSTRPFLSIVALWIGISVCYEIIFGGIDVPIKGYLFHAICLLMAGVFVLPFIVDLFFYRRLRGVTSTLLWPLTMVTISYFTVTYVPSLAYSQIEYLSLNQIVSITGIGGLVFVISWFAATLNRIWESGFDLPSVRKEGFVFLGTLILILAYGETRLAFANSHEETLSVAMISEKGNTYRDLNTFQLEDLEGLFGLSKAAADAGAKVIAWAECSAEVPFDYEEELIELGKVFAKDNQVLLLMSIRTHPNSGLNENKTIGISPGGVIVVDYLKSNLVPGVEAYTRMGDGVVAIGNIDGIRTGHVICYDMDFPTYLQQAGTRQVDILFAPSHDWREIRHFHATSARFRAVENGFSLVRPAIQGLSIATDPYGRLLSYQDYYSNSPRLSIVGVPARGESTIYSKCGDLFSFVCIVLLLGMIGMPYLKVDSTHRDMVSGLVRSES
jgi:apolipoprotein N-acyltransferase